MKGSAVLRDKEEVQPLCLTVSGGTAIHQITELKYPSYIIDHFREIFSLNHILQILSFSESHE